MYTPNPPHTTHTHATHDKHHTPICNHFPVFHWSLWHPLLEQHFAPTVNPVWNHCHQYIWAALRGDYYNSQEEHVGHNSHALWQNGTVNGNNVYATHLPQSESQYSTSSRVKCVQSTHEQRVSVWATHSKVCTNHSKCQSVWCAQTQSCFFILHYWALWWLCYIWACAMTHTAVFHVSWIWTRLNCGADLL